MLFRGTLILQQPFLKGASNSMQKWNGLSFLMQKYCLCFVAREGITDAASDTSRGQVFRDLDMHLTCQTIMFQRGQGDINMPMHCIILTLAFFLL